MVNRGIAALTAQSIVGNEGKEVFVTEMEVASIMTENTTLDPNSLLTKKDAIYMDLIGKTNNMDVVKKLKDIVSYIGQDPNLVSKNVFSEVQNLIEQLNLSNVKENEQVKMI